MRRWMIAVMTAVVLQGCNTQRKATTSTEATHEAQVTAVTTRAVETDCLRSVLAGCVVEIAAPEIEVAAGDTTRRLRAASITLRRMAVATESTHTEEARSDSVAAVTHEQEASATQETSKHSSSPLSTALAAVLALTIGAVALRMLRKLE